METNTDNTEKLTEEVLLSLGATKNNDVNEDTFPNYTLSGQTIVTNIHGFYILLKDYPINPLRTLADLQEAYLKVTGTELLTPTQQ
jgi:hypothetical protein